MTDHITLPRAVVQQALDALDCDNPDDIQLRAAIELRAAFIRAALADPVQEPVQNPATGKDSLQVQTEIERAVAAEREACALTCEAEAEKWEGDDGPVSTEARLCAIAIRARGNK